MDSNTDEEVEAREGGELGEEEEIIRRGSDDTVDTAGGRCREGARERGWGPYKAPMEDQGGTLEGRGVGQYPRVVVSRVRPEAV